MTTSAQIFEPEFTLFRISLLAITADIARVWLLGLLAERSNNVMVDLQLIFLRHDADALAAPFDRLLPLYLGISEVDQSQWDKAESALTLALDRYPEDAEAHYYMARALRAKSEHTDAAFTHLDRAHRLDPANLEYAGALLQLAEARGDIERAWEVAERNYEENPEHPLALNNSAWLSYRSARNAETALNRIERAIAREPDNLRFRHTHGCVLLWMGREQEGLAHLRAAREVTSNGPSHDVGCPGVHDSIRRTPHNDSPS